MSSRFGVLPLSKNVSRRWGVGTIYNQFSCSDEHSLNWKVAMFPKLAQTFQDVLLFYIAAGCLPLVLNAISIVSHLKTRNRVTF